MTSALKDQNLPAGVITEIYDDASAERNDRTKLTSATENPWYVLATVAGEHITSQVSPYIPGLEERNRRFWNGWMCQDMSKVAKEALAKKLELPLEDLAPLSKAELQEINSRFAAAFPEEEPEDKIPSAGDTVDLSQVHFPNQLIFKKLYFRMPARFSGAHFSQNANFEKAYFAGEATFSEAHFSAHVGFRKAHFAGEAVFQNTYFAGKVNFSEAHFEIIALFEKAYFEGRANFSEANFVGYPNFSNGAFKSATNFRLSRFITRVPRFYQREMHQDTAFTQDSRLWPSVRNDINSHTAYAGQQAYTRLRQIAASNHNPDLEHFFLRQELRCKEGLANGLDQLAIAVYRVVSDSGNSLWRPLTGLAMIITLNWGIISSYLRQSGQSVGTAAIWEGLGISIGNTLPFLGVLDKVYPDFHANAPSWLDTLSVLQSVAGIVLLFFLGLGLRNRFRLK